ncbi:NUDIX hydrolase [Sphingomonas lacunae]|uniref:NUDIX hydrolase n=1 Tax=Sphingomonas lacunae TaxID=2698828 RepID=A0A6M4AVL5_9SPHN|nr:NUDIX hydrolase [Sphingomonas lacunae]QJQ33178.1 NUDIX hydrolase [Sphingomonas lacunae]
MDTPEMTTVLPLVSHGFGNGPLDLDDDDDSGLMPAHPAATLIIYHEGTGAQRSPVLMVRRSAAMKFAAGAAVFPGGRVDSDDHVLARSFAPHMPIEDAAARVAAIRETLEETGLLIGLSHDGDDQRTQALRDGLHAGELLSNLIRDTRSSFDLESLVAFSRWRPNFEHSRLFDTRFYLTSVSGALPDLTVSDGENSHIFWIDPLIALTEAQEDKLQIIFPTRRNLERLAMVSNFGEARQSAELYPPRRVIPFVADVGGEMHLCIREDCGYPVTSEVVTTALK